MVLKLHKLQNMRLIIFLLALILSSPLQAMDLKIGQIPSELVTVNLTAKGYDECLSTAEDQYETCFNETCSESPKRDCQEEYDLAYDICETENEIPECRFNTRRFLASCLRESRKQVEECINEFGGLGLLVGGSAVCLAIKMETELQCGVSFLSFYVECTSLEAEKLSLSAIFQSGVQERQDECLFESLESIH